MEGRDRLRVRIAAMAAGLCLGALPAHSQTAVWTGGGGANSDFSAGANWMGGVAPPNNGSDVLDLGVSSTFAANNFAYIGVDTGANVSGIVLLGTSGYTYYYVYPASGSLTIGSGGISTPGGIYSDIQIDAPVVLSQSQTWGATNGYVYIPGSISEFGGSRALTIVGEVSLLGDNSFSGGVNVTSGAVLYVGTNTAAGSGPISLAAGSNLESYYPYMGQVALSNPVTLGNDVTFATYGNSNSTNALTLSGPVTLTSTATTVSLGYGATVYLTGTLGGSPSTALTIAGSSSQLPGDSGSLLVFQGTLGNVTGADVEGAALILAPTGSASGSFASLSTLLVGSGTLGQSAYLGLDGTFASTAGAVAGFLSAYGSTLGPAINGTLGFDTVAHPSSPNTFGDPIDLSGFTSPNFLGLGSATAAILGPTATITPTPNGYLFGGGGGTLTVESNLSGSAGLTMTSAPEPLTLVLQGANTYTGATNSNGGVLIFNSAPPSGLESISLNGGYVGYTENAALTPAVFVALINTGASNGVIGFDSSNPIGSPQTITANIDLSVFNTFNTPFIGTATVMTLETGTITPANGTYQFAGVKGGQLTVDSTLTGVGNSVVVGLPNPIEDNGSISAVTLGGSNSYGGGTSLNNGILYVTNPMSLGTGQLTAQNYSTAILAPLGGSVTLGNAISLSGYSTLTLGQSGNLNLLTLSGVISGAGSLYIQSDVALDGANTFSGGTYINDANVAIGNPGALGTGSVDLYNSSILTENLANPTVLDLTGDYAAAIDLIPNSTLTLNTDSNAEPATYAGSINGDGTDQVVVAGTGVEYLTGTSTYAGGTTVSSGRLIAGFGAALGSGPVTVDTGAGLGVASGVTLTNPITLVAGSALGGTGTFSPPAGLTIAGGTKITPGSDGYIAPFVGSLSFGTPLTFGAGGIYVFDLQTAGGVAGTDYDTVNANGALTITATSSSPFTIALRSVDPVTGLLGFANFNSSQAYSWTILTASSISGFSSSAFLVNTGNFQNLLGGGSLIVGENGNTLTLDFTPVPEPSTWILALSGLAALGAGALLRKRRVAATGAGP